MVSSEQATIQAAIEQIPPRDGVILVGFGLVAEWEEPSGDRMLTRLMGDGGNPWQIKGYFYDGLHGHWPSGSDRGDEHHNPGHPSGWLRIDDKA
jgi:hypothetical protein